MELSIEELFVRLGRGHLEGDEQAIFIISPANLAEFQIELHDVQLVTEETAHACRLVFHYIGGWMVITVANTKDRDAAERILRLVLSHLGVMFTKTLV